MTFLTAIFPFLKGFFDRLSNKELIDHLKAELTKKEWEISNLNKEIEKLRRRIKKLEKL